MTVRLIKCRIIEKIKSSLFYRKNEIEYMKSEPY